MGIGLTIAKDHKVANTLIDEFPCRPHWTKNTREVFSRSVKNLDPNVSVLTGLTGVSLLTRYSTSVASMLFESGSILRASIEM